MSRTGYIDQKGDDDPDPAYMHHCKEFELRSDKTAGDKLNGSIRLDEKDLNAVGAKKGDRVKVYAEANGRWVLYERDSYGDRAGVGMPKARREDLELNTDNRIVEIWLDEADEAQPESTSESENDSTGTQAVLTDEEPDEEQYVLVLDDSPITYHNISSSDDSTTECGLEFDGMEYRRFTDPGDALDHCSDCAVRSSDDMTNRELAEWLADQAGFEVGEGQPAYLTNDQFVALRDYILELQDRVAEADNSADANDAGFSEASRS